jgi:hypothetical protein
MSLRDFLRLENREEVPHHSWLSKRAGGFPARRARGSRLGVAGLALEDVAQAIYRTHWRAPSPTWEETSEEVRDWVRAQAEAAIDTVLLAIVVWHPGDGDYGNKTMRKNKKIGAGDKFPNFLQGGQTAMKRRSGKDKRQCELLLDQAPGRPPPIARPMSPPPPPPRRPPGVVVPFARAGR